jgi:hypothetical protein
MVIGIRIDRHASAFDRPVKTSSPHFPEPVTDSAEFTPERSPEMQD